MELLTRPAFEDFKLPDKVKPETRAMYKYWQSKRPGPGLLPGRKHIDPTEIPHLLPSMFLMDVVWNDDRKAYRVKFRLIGTAITNYIGRDSTGLFLDEVYPDPNKVPSYIAMKAAIERQRITIQYHPPVARPDKSFIPTERIILPLADDGETVDMVLGFTQHEVTGKNSR